MSRARRPQTDVSPSMVATIKAMYADGASLREIDKATGISRNRIGHILKSVGVKPTRGRNLPLIERKPIHSKAIIDEAIRLYVDKKLSPDAIAKIINVSFSTIGKWIKKSGYMRTQSEATINAIVTGRVTATVRRNYYIYQSTKTGRWHAAMSRLEVTRMSQLDADESVISWRMCDDRIPYFDTEKNKNRTYLPDIAVQYANETVVEEIKSKSHASKTNVKDKARAAEAYYADLGITYKIVTEDDIGIYNIRKKTYHNFSKPDDDFFIRKRKESAKEYWRRKIANETAEDRQLRLERRAIKKKMVADAQKNAA